MLTRRRALAFLAALPLFGSFGSVRGMVRRETSSLPGVYRYDVNAPAILRAWPEPEAFRERGIEPEPALGRILIENMDGPNRRSWWFGRRTESGIVVTGPAHPSVIAAVAS